MLGKVVTVWQKSFWGSKEVWHSTEHDSALWWLWPHAVRHVKWEIIAVFTVWGRHKWSKIRLKPWREMKRKGGSTESDKGELTGSAIAARLDCRNGAAISQVVTGTVWGNHRKTSRGPTRKWQNSSDEYSCQWQNLSESKQSNHWSAGMKI